MRTIKPLLEISEHCPWRSLTRKRPYLRSKKHKRIRDRRLRQRMRAEYSNVKNGVKDRKLLRDLGEKPYNHDGRCFDFGKNVVTKFI